MVKKNSTWRFEGIRGYSSKASLSDVGLRLLAMSSWGNCNRNRSLLLRPNLPTSHIRGAIKCPDGALPGDRDCSCAEGPKPLGRVGYISVVWLGKPEA